MAESERTLKRSRTSEPESGESSSKPVQSTQVWFEDGNVVLQAQLVQFRAHRSVLCTNSSVFKDIFDIAQPSEGGVDSPIHVPEEAEDICYLLKTIYDRSYFRKNPTFELVSAILRMATKYMVHHLRDEAIAYLVHDYPSKLALWDNQRVSKNRSITTRPHPYSVVSLARLCNVPVVLPAAFLECILDCHLGELFEDSVSGNLSLDDKRACLDGVEEFAATQKTTFLYLARPDTPNVDSCKHPSKCLQIKASLLWHLASQPLSLRGMHSWSLFAGDPPMCFDCLAACSRMHEEGRLRMWNDLPRLFRLPPWTELTT